jgi:hypothetical protein
MSYNNREAIQHVQKNVEKYQNNNSNNNNREKRNSMEMDWMLSEIATVGEATL